MTDDDPLWCYACGRVVPWKHIPRPTLRARIARRLLAGVASAERAIERWRDAPRAKAERRAGMHARRK